MTTQAQIRASFWESHPELETHARKRKTRSKGQNEQNATTRTAFVDFVDSLAKSGQITPELAQRATL